jgi:hypothetical protein
MRPRKISYDSLDRVAVPTDLIMPFLFHANIFFRENTEVNLPPGIYRAWKIENRPSDSNLSFFGGKARLFWSCAPRGAWLKMGGEKPLKGLALRLSAETPRSIEVLMREGDKWSHPVLIAPHLAPWRNVGFI